jgi:DNA-binding NtrC family response regulator
MSREFDQLNIRQKMVLLIDDMVDKELPLNEALDEFKKIYIAKSSIKYKNVKTRMAEAMGIHRNTLNNLVKSLKIK